MTESEAIDRIKQDGTLTNAARFELVLTEHYRTLFASRAEYGLAAKRFGPAQLAEKMVQGLLAGCADKGGDGVKRTCRDLGINHTYDAIVAYLGGRA